jgi:hypothetical protein
MLNCWCITYPVGFKRLMITCWVRKILNPILILNNIYIFLAQQPPVGQSVLIHEVSRSHTTTHHSRYDSSGRVISPSQRSLPDNTRHSQQTDIHAAGGIRIHNLSRRAAANVRLRPHGHWDWRVHNIYS